MKFKHLLLTATLLLSASNIFAAKTLTFATEATYPPFASVDAQGQMIGFGPDLSEFCFGLPGLSLAALGF